MNKKEDLTVMAIGAHPDDIEFMMGGTLLLLGELGADLYMWNLANGNCGTAVHPSETIIEMRAEEARNAAEIAGAKIFPPLRDDLTLLYDVPTLRKVAARIREAKPDIILAPSPQDYMEDHQNASRLAVTAAFARGMCNFVTDPEQKPWGGQTVIYHALPYGLHDGLRRLIKPETYLDITSVLKTKRKMLSQHRSQKEWLDASQGLNAYLETMEDMSAEVGQMSGKFDYAEGWRRHSHLGFAAEDHDPLTDLLSDRCIVDPAYLDDSSV